MAIWLTTMNQINRLYQIKHPWVNIFVFMSVENTTSTQHNYDNFRCTSKSSQTTPLNNTDCLTPVMFTTGPDKNDNNFVLSFPENWNFCIKRTQSFFLELDFLNQFIVPRIHKPLSSLFHVQYHSLPFYYVWYTLDVRSNYRTE